MSEHVVAQFTSCCLFHFDRQLMVVTQKERKEEDQKHTNMDVNSAQSEIFKELEMFYETGNAFDALVMKDTVQCALTLLKWNMLLFGELVKCNSGKQKMSVLVLA